MPTYTYQKTANSEPFDIRMSIAEMEQYEKDNPEIKRVYTAITIGDSVRLGVKKPPADFQKYVLGRIKEMPGVDKSKIDRRWQSAREF